MGQSSKKWNMFHIAMLNNQRVCPKISPLSLSLSLSIAKEQKTRLQQLQEMRPICVFQQTMVSQK